MVYSDIVANIRRARFLSLAFFCAAPASAAPTLLASNLADLSFEQLAEIQITSVSKKPERLADAAASLFVITAEDIRRSGAASLPEVLRLAPNLQVGQVSASGYAISARGMNGSNNSTPNKLLVLIDGRSVYSPLFAGVFWDAQEVMLEDVERIEVISGPGGTLWGTNAVNGVINVITRTAHDTQGALAAAGAGSGGADLAFRYGAPIGAGGHYRVYGTYRDRNHTSSANDLPVNDSWYKTQVGWRADWERPGQQFMVQGNAYSGAGGQAAPGAIRITGVNIPLGPISLSGVNLTSRWSRLLDTGASLSFQAYYDRTMRTASPIFGETLDILDLQFQHALRPAGMHALVWGANYRYGMDRVSNSPYFAFLPANVEQRWASLFAQDDIALRENLRLTVGARVERNDYTGNEFLPSARLAWKPSPEHLLWMAASRAVRAPSRLDADPFIPGVAPFLLRGGPAVRSELARVYELGYRGQPSPRFSYSVTAFHTAYDQLRTQEIAPSRTFVVFGNQMQGAANGIETWGTYQATPAWRLSAGFTALHERLWLKPSSNDTAAPEAAGNDPAHTWQLRASWNGASNREFDLTVRHVAALAKNVVRARTTDAAPAYTTLDARFAWQLRPGLDLSVAAQNLLGHHVEYGYSAYRTELGPTIAVKLLWRY